MDQLVGAVEAKLSPQEIAVVKAVLEGKGLENGAAEVGLARPAAEVAVKRAIDCLRSAAVAGEKLANDKKPTGMRISPLAFLRSLGAIFRSVFHRPLKTTDVDLLNGQVFRYVEASDWPPALGPDDPPIDFSRESAAYELQRERLVRDHLGKIALIHQDEVVGAFATADEAILEGYRRFGLVRMMLQEIRDPDTPDFIPLVDTQHPSFKRIG